MKKRSIVIITLMLVFILLYFILNYFVLNFFSNRYFSVDYDVSFKVLSSKNNTLSLISNNGSSIEITANEVDEDVVKDELYLNIEREFQKQNSEYVLINYDEVMIGKEFYHGYQYLYETDEQQTLFVIVIVDEVVLQISYTAVNQVFDIDLESYYSIINSIEIRE